MNAPVAASAPEQFRDAVAVRLGLRFEDSKLGFLGEVLQRRAAACGSAIPAYLADIVGGVPSDEAGPLAEELTIGETCFFRNSDQFRAFAEVVLPGRMTARGSSRQLSFLSAGCSSGEEPFTIAMLARERIPDPDWAVAIRAIDLNPAALRKAAAGRFGSWALRETPNAMRERWFAPDGRDVVLDPLIRGAVQFDRRNLADPGSDIWQPGAYDAIFCRNVVMYFTPAVQEAVIGRLARALVPGGYLFLGHAETLRGLSQDFHLVHTHDTFYYQRKGAGETAAGHLIDVGTTVRRTAMPPQLPPGDIGWYEAIGSSSRRIEMLAEPAMPPTQESILPLASLGAALELMRRDRFGEALELVEAMPPAARRDPDVLLLEAMLCVGGGRLAAAAQVCELLLEADELNAGANYVLGLCFEGLGDDLSAIHHYHVAGHLDPQFAMARLRGGLLARRAGELTEARRDLAQALELLRHEDAARLLLFGGGFSRDGLIRLCRAELQACEVAP